MGSIHIDRMLTYRKHVETTALKCKKGFSVLNSTSSYCIKEWCSVIDYGLGLTAMAQTNLLRLDKVQNEAMRVILGTTKDTPLRPCGL